MEKFDTKNIDIDKAGNITVKDISGSEITINLTNTKEVKDFLESIMDQINQLPNKVLLELVKAGYGLSSEKRSHDVQIVLRSRKNDNIFRPKFLKKTTHYKLKEKENSVNVIPNFARIESMKISGGLFGPTRINHGLCRINVSIINSGQIALENWKLWMYFDPKEVRKIDDCYPKGVAGWGVNDYRTVYVYEDDLSILYKPSEEILIQKDSKSFKCLCLPQFDVENVTVKVHLLAKDFDYEDEFTFEVQSSFHEEETIKFVNNASQIKKVEEIIDYITEE